MINRLIHYTHEMGWGQAIYNSAFPIIIAALLVYYLSYRKRYGISIKQAIIIMVIVFSSIVILLSMTALIANGFQDASGWNILRVFVYVPLVCVLLAKILKMPVGIILDYVIPSVALYHIVGQSVCPFLGCCAGIPCRWGIWNPFLDETVFPIQWLICLAALGVMLLILRYEKQHNYDGNGKAYPIFLIVYGVLRFFLEFLKRRERLILGVSELGLQALFMVLVGTIWILTIEEIGLEDKRKAELNRQKRRK